MWVARLVHSSRAPLGVDFSSLAHDREHAMAQEKKKSYSLYTPLGQKLITLLRKYEPTIAAKSTDKELMADVIRMAANKNDGQSPYILCEEFKFRRQGSQVIFPESPVILDNLLRARYSVETVDGFNLPFESFMLAVPRGYAHNGFLVPGLLVTVIKLHSIEPDLLHPLLDEYDVPRATFKLTDHTVSDMLSIVYTDPGSSEKCRAFLSLRDIPAVLQTRSPSDYRDFMFSKGFLRDKSAMSDHNSAIEFNAFKLVLALGVYHAATRGDKLHAGFPAGDTPRLDGWKPGRELSPVTLTSSIPPSADGTIVKDAFYRTWFFRQLRADRYYKGEFSHYAPGTRYSFVSETVVGMDVTAYTQT